MMAVVNPMAPQPMTAMCFSCVASAIGTITRAVPHDSDQPLPPWPYAWITDLRPMRSISMRGPAARNGRVQTLIEMIRSAAALIGASGCGARNALPGGNLSIGAFELFKGDSTCAMLGVNALVDSAPAAMPPLLMN